MLVIDPNTELFPLLPVLFVTGVPPAPMVTVYEPAVNVSLASADAPPPEDSPTTDER
jgi:hypothetical protein